MKKIIWIVVAVFVLLWLWLSYFTVDSWETAVKVTLWKVWETTYSNWLYFKVPFITNIVKYDIRNKKVELDSSASSLDLQDVKATIAINYTLDSTKIAKIYKELWKKDQIENNIIIPSIQEIVKSEFAKFSAENLVKKRSEVSEQIRKWLIEKFQPYWITLLDTNIVNFQFSQSFNQAIEAKVTAEQEALAEKNKLEKVKYQAEQEIEKAKWEAEKIRINAEAIQKQWWENYIKLEFIKKWNWQLPTVISSDWASNILDISSIMK